MGTTYTLSGSLGDVVDGGVAGVHAAYIRTNLPDGMALVDTTADEGGIKPSNIGRIPLSGDAFSIDLLGTANTGLNVAANTLRYRVVVEYGRPGVRGLFTWESDWFELTADADLKTIIGELELVPPSTVADQLAARIDGNADSDHGEVSGDLDLDPEIGTHVLDATGPTTLVLGDGPAGGIRYVTVYVVSGADDVTVEGIPDAELTDGVFATFAWIRDSWLLAAAGGPSTPGETTPPTAGTLAGSAISDAGFTLTVTGASDETALASSPYSFSTDNGSTWSAYQSSAVKVITGKTASTAYQCKHRVRDAAGNVTVGTMVTVTTEGVGARTLKLSRDPLYYYPVDDDAGTTAPANLGSGGGAAAVTGAVTFGSTGLADTDASALFAGGYITLPVAANLNGLSAFTVEFLVERTSGTHLVHAFDSYLFTNSWTQVKGDFSFTPPPMGSPGHLIGVTYDGAIARVYGDGVEVATFAVSGAISASVAPKIGAEHGGGGTFAGRIGEFIIYTECLDAADMLATAVAHGLA